MGLIVMVVYMVETRLRVHFQQRSNDERNVHVTQLSRSVSTQRPVSLSLLRCRQIARLHHVRVLRRGRPSTAVRSHSYYYSLYHVTHASRCFRCLHIATQRPLVPDADKKHIRCRQRF